MTRKYRRAGKSRGSRLLPTPPSGLLREASLRFWDIAMYTPFPMCHLARYAYNCPSERWRVVKQLSF